MVLDSGYEIALACGPLQKQRFINDKIEAELVEFKQEITDKFEKSSINKHFKFPRVPFGGGSDSLATEIGLKKKIRKSSDFRQLLQKFNMVRKDEREPSLGDVTVNERFKVSVNPTKKSRNREPPTISQSSESVLEIDRDSQLEDKPRAR